MYNTQTRDCRLLDQDRHTLAGRPVFNELEGNDYLELNCKGNDVSEKKFYKVMGTDSRTFF